ncbi:23473_t:CDS:2 [Cetraspora pellucida]|uniref:23473_t:CDS:1 n=1 Tax=Cetraspora pellucida TaxID=1433469 RepID=A0A9N9P7Q6_9GLOM|nr:23473_t:CDS:2 [Cetraspora pellucida]
MDFVAYSSCVLLELKVVFLDGFIRLLWKSSIFPNFNSFYNCFCKQSTFSANYIKPYPSKLFSEGYDGVFNILDNSIIDYSKDYFLFLEKNITSLEDFIFFLFENCPDSDKFTSIYHYYFVTSNQHFWHYDFFGSNFYNNKYTYCYTSLQLPCEDLSTIFVDLSLKDDPSTIKVHSSRISQPVLSGIDCFDALDLFQDFSENSDQGYDSGPEIYSDQGCIYVNYYSCNPDESIDNNDYNVYSD